MYDAISLKTVKSKLLKNPEYVSSYRVMDNGEVHYYQFTYIPINANIPGGDILAGFKNVDDIVASAKERQNLEILVSAGAVFFKEGDKRSFEELYKLADSDVYESKKVNGSALNFR